MHSKVLDKNISTLIHSQPVLGSFILNNDENVLVSLTETRLYLWTRISKGVPARECDYSNVYYMNQRQGIKYICMRQVGKYLVVADNDGCLSIFSVNVDVQEIELLSIIPSLKKVPIISMTYTNHNLFVLHAKGRLLRFLGLDRTRDFERYRYENEKQLVPIALNKRCKLIEAHQYGKEGDGLPDLLFAQDGANLAVYGYMPETFSLLQPLQRFGYVSPKLQKPDASVIHATALKVINNILVVGNKYGYVATYKVILVPLEEQIHYHGGPTLEMKKKNSKTVSHKEKDTQLDVASDMYGSPLIRLRSTEQVMNYKTRQADFHLSFHPIQSFWNHGCAISSVAINYYTLQLISFDVKGFCSVTDIKHNIVQQKYVPHCDIVSASVIDFKNHFLLTASHDYTVKLWHACMPSEEEIQQMKQIDEEEDELLSEDFTEVMETTTIPNIVNELQQYQ